MKEKGRYLVCGALAGTLNGCLGTGGGVVLVPLLLYWLKLPQRQAFATSVFIILPVSLVSAVCYFFTGGMDLPSALPYLLGGFAGGLLSGKLYTRLPVTLLRRIFGAVLIFGGVRAVAL